MATLNIGGKRVKVGDEFLRMTPEQQNAAVEEIAGQIGSTGQQPSEYGQSLARASQMSQFAKPAPAGPDLMGSTAATLGGIVNGIPILGPAVQKTSDAMLAGGGMLADQFTGNQGPDLGGRMQALEDRRAQIAAANPVADIAGNVGGSIASLGLGASTKVGAEALGMSGPLIQRGVNSGLSTLGLGTIDNMVRGQQPTDAMANAAGPAAISSAVPFIGRALGVGGKAVGNAIAPTVNAVLNPVKEGARRVGMAIMRDLNANPASLMNAADEAVAAKAGVPLINADRGGETTRALTRSVANQSPEARAIVQKTADDRFSSQAPRAVAFIKQLTGGAVDDLGYQKSIQDVARMVNKPRYDAAYSSPQAAAVWTPEIKQLMQSDLFRNAINAAESRGTDFAAVSGVKAVRNPFVFRPDGTITLRQMPDGSHALPSLQFWDQVKRNLDGMIGKAQRAGDNQEASVLTQMKSQLVGALDNQVPQYQAARQGAASFFGAEDALEAGKKFVAQPRTIPEATAAFSKFTAAEKQAFSTGYASELIDRLKVPTTGRNVIKQFFDPPAAREMNELVFGPAKARQLEAYVRVEAIADQLRGAMGNSTTARQLMELGIGGGAGFALTGDWKGAIAGAAMAKGNRYLGEKVDGKVMQEVAKLLTSNDPAALQRAVSNATLSPVWMAALERVQLALETTARGAELNPTNRPIGSGNENGPLRITVQGATVGQHPY